MYKILSYNRSYNRKKFSCGNDELDSYIKNYISQDIRRNLCKAFVALDDNNVVGFYTLSSYAVAESDIGNLPYSIIPAVLIGRLAVDSAAKKKGLGRLLLKDALSRIVNASHAIGIHTICVEAKNIEAQSFYKKYGFIEYPSDKLKLYLPIKSIKHLY